MTENKFDIAIIGGGPGGYVAAIRASQLGYRVALVEREHLGGICLNWGCIPTKALLRSSEIYHLMHNLDQFGLSAENIKFDFKKIIERSRNVSKKLTEGIKHLMKKNKVEVFNGYGKLNGVGKISVRESGDRDSKRIADIESRHIIFATGARAKTFPGLEHDEQQVWSYKKAMTPDAMPKTLVVIGSGAIGTEFASFYKNMGVDVTLVEAMDRILPVEDKEVSAFMQKTFEKQGLKIKTNVQASIEKGKDEVTVNLKAKDGTIEKIKVEKVIVAVGVMGNTENLGLEGTRVKIERNQIQIDEFCKTDEDGIYAIGDVVSAPWLAHKASHEGIICVENIAYLEGKFDHQPHPIVKENIPGCTYCYPQVASVGLTEDKAKEKGYSIKVGRFPYIGNGKAIAMGETEGFIKTIFDAQTGELLGAHMVGSEVTEMIQGYVVGKTAELTNYDFMHTIFAHPTLSEMMHEAVLDADKQAIHF
ncbi:MAG TPA: dihydrolipoyl dehydrogenase [Alphaproteobacteria bacterium]|nr:dihydrolipoyl dehydrogenase [Alphaproteobacteria bacterium]